MFSIHKKTTHKMMTRFLPAAMTALAVLVSHPHALGTDGNRVRSSVIGVVAVLLLLLLFL
jgi:hypothetical protein